MRKSRAQENWSEEVRQVLKDYFARVEDGEITAEQAYTAFSTQFKGLYLYITPTPNNFKQKIIDLLETNLTDREIAYQVGCTYPAVTYVRKLILEKQ